MEMLPRNFLYLLLSLLVPSGKGIGGRGEEKNKREEKMAEVYYFVILLVSVSTP